MATLREFWTQHEQAEQPLRSWYKVLTIAAPRNFSELRTTFGSVDYVRDKKDAVGWHIFDVGGNNYRVICKLDFEHQFALIKAVLSHTEYERWTNNNR